MSIVVKLMWKQLMMSKKILMVLMTGHTDALSTLDNRNRCKTPGVLRGEEGRGA